LGAASLGARLSIIARLAAFVHTTAQIHLYASVVVSTFHCFLLFEGDHHWDFFMEILWWKDGSERLSHPFFAISHAIVTPRNYIHNIDTIYTSFSIDIRWTSWIRLHTFINNYRAIINYKT
jgi:hypothetical protein